MSNEMKLVGIATSAVNDFTTLYGGAAVSCSSNTGELRSKGINADSVFIDCMKSKKRIAVMTLDDKPGVFAIGVANKATPDDVNFTELADKKLNVSTVLGYMEDNFAR